MNYIDTRETAADQGMIHLQPGDVLKFGDALHVVDYVNDCRARAVSIGEPKLKQFDTRWGDRIQITNNGSSMNISPLLSPEHLVERRGKQWVEEWLASKTAARNHKTKAVEGTVDMKDKTKARGGLAAEATQIQQQAPVAATAPVAQAAAPVAPAPVKAKKAAKAPKAKAAKAEKSTTPGRLGGWFGNTVVSVIKMLAKKGLENAHIAAICEANGIKVAPATLAGNARLGRKGEGVMATLTKEQLAGLMAVPAPVKAEQVQPTKVVKAKKATKKAKAPKAAAPVAAPAETTAPAAAAA